jgi:predicted TIM-barrel fold metal-dependent hydrolase
MLKFLPKSNILYGSDYPFGEPAHGIEELDAYPLSQSMRAAIDAENALLLFPRLSSQ